MAHSHEDHENYFLDQIFTIALCGALAGVAIMLWSQDLLKRILDSKFHPYVLAGGIVLLVLVAIRALAVWQLAGQTAKAHAHGHHHHHAHHEHHEHHEHAHCEHDHHHDCGHDHHHHHSHGDHHHDHHHHDHDHGHGDHGHDHDWAPWRYSVLLLPVVLYFLDLPRQGYINDDKPPSTEVQAFSPTSVTNVVGLLASPGTPVPLLATTVMYPDRDDRLTTMVGLADDTSPPMYVRFTELERAAYSAESRNFYLMKKVTVIGKFTAGTDSRRFGLVRYKMNCCAADALPLNSIVMVHPSWQGEQLDFSKCDQQWVKVTGRIYFYQKAGSSSEYVTALIVCPTENTPPNKLVQVIDQPGNPWAD